MRKECEYLLLSLVPIRISSVCVCVRSLEPDDCKFSNQNYSKHFFVVVVPFNLFQLLAFSIDSSNVVALVLSFSLTDPQSFLAIFNNSNICTEQEKLFNIKRKIRE